MLQSLRVRNYAIIDELELDLSGNLTIITGETGAGKSILIGALSLILGERADMSVLYNKEKKCIVEGVFKIGSAVPVSFFEENDLDYDPVTIIRRQINPAGKSRAFINDTPVTLDTLRNLTRQLVDIHKQHETLNLSGSDFQMLMIDAMAGNTRETTVFRDKFNQLRKLKSNIKTLEAAAAEAIREKDFLEFQLQEIESLQLENKDELALLEEELTKLNHAETIIAALTKSGALLESGEYTALNLLSEARQNIQSIARYSTAYSELFDRLASAIIELNDIAAEISKSAETVEHNDARAQEISDRLNQIYRLLKKHTAEGIADLLAIYADIGEKLGGFDSMESDIEKLRNEESKLEATLNEIAQNISLQRSNTIPGFKDQVNNLLPQVGLPKATFDINHTIKSFADAGENGIDDISFLFTANPGSPPLEIKKVASGGELSRLMLVIKSLVAANVSLPTMIFDEIDAGISGEVGMQVGNILQALGKAHQVVCITHLPQIAGKGNAHYYIRKTSTDSNTYTEIKRLNQEERIVEIAKMISGDKPSPAALENARELLMN